MTIHSRPATGIIAEIIDNHKHVSLLMAFQSEENDLCLYKGEVKESDYESFCASILDFQPIECSEIIVDYENNGVVACYRVQDHLWIVLATTKKEFPRINLEIKKLLEGEKNSLQEYILDDKENIEKKVKLLKDKVPKNKILSEVSILEQFSSKYFAFDHPGNNESGGFYWIKAEDGLVQIVVADQPVNGFDRYEYHAILNSIMEKNIGPDIDQSVKAVQHALDTHKTEMLKGVELGICYYHKGKSVVHVVSSGVPILYVSEDNYASVIRPKTVATRNGNKSKTNQQTLDMSKGDKLVMYTSGLSGQIDKNSNLKLGHKGVRKLFQAMNGNFSSSYFEQELNGWMGDTPCYADITVLAIQI